MLYEREKRIQKQPLELYIDNHARSKTFGKYKFCKFANFLIITMDDKKIRKIFNFICSKTKISFLLFELLDKISL